MQRNKKLAILIVLVTGVVFIWIPKGKKANNIMSPALSSNLDQAIPTIRVVSRKRTEFVGWGRNPFAEPQEEREEKKVVGISDLKLHAIILGNKPSALINNSIVSVGDKITDKTIKQVEPNRVILTDGTKDYVLKLNE